MVQDTNFICPRIYNACRLCKIRGNQLNKINQVISDKIYECTTLKIISTPQCKAFICDGCKAKIDEHYQFKMQCIKNVNLQRFNNGTIGPIAETPGSSTEGSEPTATASALVEAIPSSSSKAD
ncbi:uncharacterized protein LOC109408741 [Aedes albopictus]|uniref:ZAD domain-containing protein n=1 Tax=Aedes albopictus TaxID=7160 RepID=A0A023EDI6_AEDAL|nr:uncharacterized protein LOC109408741 [Aedes albopictus]XP_029730791.1 uncharacterized protein LOC115267735 [Aedes albopictus]